MDEYCEVRERYLARKDDSNHNRSRAEELKDVKAGKIKLDALEAKTIGRINIFTLIDMARWDWNKKNLYQAFTGVEDSTKKRSPVADPEGRFTVMKPLETQPANLPEVTVSAVASYLFPTIPSNMLRNIKRGDYAIMAQCGLFTVKKTLELLRLIFNAKPANACFGYEQVSALALCALKVLMSALDEFIWNEEVYYLSGDLRHFYYQLLMPVYYAMYMCIFISATDMNYIPLVMTMGFFPVCTWAQTVTLSIILRTIPGDCLYGVAEEQVNTTMPRIIWLYENRWKTKPGETCNNSLGKKIGFIVVIIDGFLLVTENRRLKESWRNRIWRNINDCNAELKIPPEQARRLEVLKKLETNPHKRVKLEDGEKLGLEESTTGVTFFGLVIESRKGWKPDAQLHPMIEAESTRRQWSRVLGGLLWAVRVKREPLVEKEEMMAAYAHLYSEGIDGWDKMMTMPEDAVKALTKEHKKYSNREFTSRQVMPAIKLIYAVASDAQLHGKGEVVYAYSFDKKELNVIYEIIEVNEEPQKQIEQETDASVDGTLQVRKHLEETNYNFQMSRVGVLHALDADPARFALEKEYSRSSKMRATIRRRREHAPEHEMSSLYCRVPGLDLVADFPSRGMYAYHQEKNTPEMIEAYKASAKFKGSTEELYVEVERRKRKTEAIILEQIAICFNLE